MAACAHALDIRVDAIWCVGNDDRDSAASSAVIEPIDLPPLRARMQLHVGAEVVLDPYGDGRLRCDGREADHAASALDARDPARGREFLTGSRVGIGLEANHGRARCLQRPTGDLNVDLDLDGRRASGIVNREREVLPRYGLFGGDHGGSGACDVWEARPGAIATFPAS